MSVIYEKREYDVVVEAEEQESTLCRNCFRRLSVHHTDDYLREKLLKVSGCENEIENEKIYHIIYENERAVALEQIK